MNRRAFLAGLLAAAPAAGRAAPVAERERWLKAVTEQTGDTRALERLGVWLQLAPRVRVERQNIHAMIRELRRAQEESGYLGIYPPADRLGASGRGVDEYWGTAEMGRGLAALADAGYMTAMDIARPLGHRLLAVAPEQLDRVAGRQHPAATALLYFLCWMAERGKAPIYRKYLSTLPGRIGLPNEKAPFEPALAPVLPEWGSDPRRAARGLTALSGMVALARYQKHDLFEKALRARWSELRSTFPAHATAELAARWVRLTLDLYPAIGKPAEVGAELQRVAQLELEPDYPYSDLASALLPPGRVRRAGGPGELHESAWLR